MVITEKWLSWVIGGLRFLFYVDVDATHNFHPKLVNIKDSPPITAFVEAFNHMQNEQKNMRDNAFAKLAEGDVREAFLCISQIIATENYTLDDLYLAGQWALDSGFYVEAIELLTRTLSESELAKETWYIDSAYIARAYARILIGEFAAAQEDLTQIKDNVELSWLLNLPSVSKLSLLAQIYDAIAHKP